MISIAEAIALAKLTTEEERDLCKLEAVIDASIHDKFTGAPMNLVFEQEVAARVAFAIQRKYEEGGWRVAVDRSVAGGKACAFKIAPIYAPRNSATPAAPSAPAKTLPSVALHQPPKPAKRRLLVRMPTRGRPRQALEVLEKYRDMAGVAVQIEVVIDIDDDTMMAPEVLQRLCALGVTITAGHHCNKVDACNGGRVYNWDILLLASDDMVPVTDGYAARVITAMEEKYPHLDGAIYFNDGFQGQNLCTLPIMGRRLYEQFGYVYCPEYQSLFCDTEQTRALVAMNRIEYVDEKIIEHRHHVWGKAEKDALYVRNDALWDKDKATYERREREGLFKPEIALSLCIATLPARRERLEHLLDHLWDQILQDAPLRVEVNVDSREGVTIGEKRQSMIERAIGQYAAFIDDDDWIAHDYVYRIVKALDRSPGVDCASLSGVMTTAGEVPESFDHSISNKEWRTENFIHYRSPNHLNAVRRDLALKAGFSSAKHGEDFAYSERLTPLLNTEAPTGDKPLYYYWFWPGKGETGQ